MPVMRSATVLNKLRILLCLVFCNRNPNTTPTRSNSNIHGWMHAGRNQLNKETFPSTSTTDFNAKADKTLLIFEILEVSTLCIKCFQIYEVRSGPNKSKTFIGMD